MEAAGEMRSWRWSSRCHGPTEGGRSIAGESGRREAALLRHHDRRERWRTAAAAGGHASGSSAAAANAIEGRGRGGVKKDRKF